MADHSKNEGEGNRTAAKEYNEKTKRFVDNADVEAKAEDARDAVERDDQGTLADAEQRGKSKARDFDPEVERDR